MFSLRTTIFLLATITLTLATPTIKPVTPAATPEVPALGYNYTDTFTLSSGPIPEGGYLGELKIAKHVDGDERLVFRKMRISPEVAAGHSLTSTYYQFRNKAKITAMEVKNLNPKNGGKAFILAGGVGNDFLTLRFLTEPNNSLEYDIAIWCK